MSHAYFGCSYDEAVGVIMPAGLSHSTDGEATRCRGRR